MKRFLILLIVTLVFTVPDIHGQLSIDSCQAKAKANYPLVKRYGLIEKSGEYNLSNAGKNYLPQFLFSAKATYQSEVTKLPISIPGINVESISKDQYGATVDVNQSIWDGGITQAQKKVIKANTEVEQQQLHVDMYKLEERVNQLFFGILLFDAQLQQNHTQQEVLRLNHNRVASYMENGIANQADLDAVQVEQLKARQLETQLQSNRTAYISMLSAMIGEPLDENIVLIKPNVENTLVPAQINRPELKLFEAQNRLYESQKKSIGTTYMPKLNLFMQGGYGKPGLNMLKNEFSPYYIGGVRMSWNLGALYTQKNDRRKLEIGQRNVETQKETFLYNTNLEVTQENQEIKRLKGVMDYDSDIINLRESVRKSAEAKVANGTLSVIELMREVNAENLARQDKASHEIELLMAIYRLKNTTNN